MTSENAFSQSTNRVPTLVGMLAGIARMRSRKLKIGRNAFLWFGKGKIAKNGRISQNKRKAGDQRAIKKMSR